MYTDINIDLAIFVQQKWFKIKLPNDFNTDLILKMIERLMKYNVFTFGNRFFLQKNGTAMGTNVACMYVTI